MGQQNLTMKTLNILVVEDARMQRRLLREFLADEGYQVVEAENGESALENVRKEYFDLLLIDYKMPGMDGLTLLESVKGLNPEVDVIVMTAHGSTETAIRALKAGAVDYLSKPVDLEELLLTIERIAEKRILKRENELLWKKLSEEAVPTNQIIYQSAAMQEVVNLAGRIAASQATVLLEGESGTGKELLARLIHSLSPRAHRPMITVNCMALSESLLESELFGHEKGAFTGAAQRRIGLFEEADGSTLFLDEIGDLSAAIQVKLLRFLQEHEFHRVGGNKPLYSDVRIISAANRNLRESVQTGTFREDLFYRLNVVSLRVPPLRERKEDLAVLIDHFIRKFATENRKKVSSLTAEARDLLFKYDYPGNVRELENIIERAVVIARDETIVRRDLPFHENLTQPATTNKHSTMNLKKAVEHVERSLILEALEKTENHQTKAAQHLGISERMLRYKLKKYRLKKSEP